MLPPTWKFLQANYVPFHIELQETLQPELQHCTADVLLGVCWLQGLLPFVLFCNREAVGISKEQSTGMKTKEQKVTWKKTPHWSIKNYWPWIETFFKSYISAAKNQPWGVEIAEWKIQSQAQFNLKISKRVFLKLLLHKSSWDSVLSSFNIPLFAGGFWKPLDKAAVSSVQEILLHSSYELF